MRPEVLRGSVVRRTGRMAPAESGASELALEIQLSAPLKTGDVERIEAEVWHAQVAPIAGTIPVSGVGFRGEQVTISLGPIPADAIRLDALWAMLARRGCPFGSSVSAFIVERLASIAGALHRSSDLAGAPRIHGRLSKHAVLIAGSGGVSLLGAGFPLLDALVVPAPDSDVDRLRYLAPEVARGGAPEGRSDLYALAVMYYELLAGAPYREQLRHDDVLLRAIEGHPPDLPGRLPDPRPGLLDILRAALDAQPERRFSVMESFGAAVRAEARPSEDVRVTLGRLVTEFARGGVVRGAECAVARDTPIAASHVIGAPRLAKVIARSVVLAEEPKLEEALVAPETEPNGWAAVLGEDVTQQAGAKQPERAATPTPKKPAKLELPKPRPEVKRELTALPSAPAPAAGAVNPLENLTFALEPSARSKRMRQIGPGTVNALRFGAVLIVLLFCGGLYLLMKRYLPAADDESPSLRNRMRKAAQKARGVDVDEKKAPVVPPPPREILAAEQQTETATVETKTGLLSIISNPSGATVLIDGGFAGKTPLIMRHKFEKPEYQVELVLEGYKPWSQGAGVDPNTGSLTVVATLEKK